MWKASEPVVGSWIRQNLGPGRIVNDVREGLKAVRRLAEAAPEIAAKAEKLNQDIAGMVDTGLRFDPETAEAIGRSEARHNRSGRVALWVMAATLVYIAVQLT